MKSTATLKNLMVPALLLSLIPISSSHAASLDSLKEGMKVADGITRGTLVKHFLVMPSLQELLRGKTEDNNLLDQGPLTISVHDLTNLLTACLVNCVWSAHVNKDGEELADVIKHTCFGEGAYKVLVTLGKAVGFNQSLSEETRRRVAVFVAPFLKEVLATMVQDALH